MNKDKKVIINDYILLCEEKSKFYLDFDYKKHNIITKKLIRLDKVLKSEIDLAHNIINELINHHNTSLAIWINELAIDIDYRRNEAISNLLDIEKVNSNNLYSTDIKLFLSEKGIIESPW